MLNRGKLPFTDQASAVSNCAVTTTTIDSPGNAAAYPNKYDTSTKITAKTPNDFAVVKGVQADTKCKLAYEGDVIKVLKCVCGDVYAQHTVMFDIESVKVYNNKYDEPRSMTMTFKNGKSVTASVDNDDVFSVYHGIVICLLKYMLGEKANGCETSVFNKLMDHAHKVLDKTKARELAAKEEAKRLEAKHKKLAAKKQRRKAKKREYEIELRKEAYIRAMNEMQNNPL